MVSNVCTLINGNEKENAFFVSSPDGNTLIIDPGSDPQLIINQLHKLNLKPVAILATHAHWDHISAVDELKTHYNIPFYLHQNEAKLLKSLNLYRMLVAKMPLVNIPKVDYKLVSDNVFQICSFEITPFLIGAHTAGSCFLLINNHLFTGDIIYKGRLDDQTVKSNSDNLKVVIEKISNLAEEIIIYPGHGSKSTLSYELNHNSDLQNKLL
ncbi:MAG: MBL fold metallo-hydrolase [Bacteroidota bacterium]